ncbi:MAG: metallophosphoesterase [Nitrospirota bacterium]
MLIFLFIVTILSTANIYIFIKISSLVNLGTISDILIGTVILFMTISPVLIPVYSNRGSERSLRVFSYIGYMWLAFLVPFFPGLVICDLYNLAIQYSSALTGQDSGSIMLSRQYAFFIPLLVSLIVIIYGYFEARYFFIERILIKSPKLPEKTGRVRIVQISDLHLGAIVRDKVLKKVLQLVEDEKPDIIVSTGDLVDGVVRHIDHLSYVLKNTRARLGKFAVLGNHELYGGTKNTVQFVQDSGFTVLREKGITVDNTINIAGMDFTGGEAGKFNSKSHKEEQEVLSDLPQGLFTLLLKHRSDVEDRSLGLFDLQLSGHTHKGQIFPMNLATMFIFQYHSGLTELPKGSSIYVSRGTGTAGPPVRLLSRPEITVIDIVSK